RGLQAISGHYPCALALFVYRNQARGQHLIRSSDTKQLTLSTPRLSCSHYFGHSLANFGSKLIIEDSTGRCPDCLGGLVSCSKMAY
ncbi:unnamed protein product, partial [Hymenolepis diminuta]